MSADALAPVAGPQPDSAGHFHVCGVVRERPIAISVRRNGVTVQKQSSNFIQIVTLTSPDGTYDGWRLLGVMQVPLEWMERQEAHLATRRARERAVTAP